jgi:hypothetical protein
MSLDLAENVGVKNKELASQTKQVLTTYIINWK